MAAQRDPSTWPVHHFRAMGCEMSVRRALSAAAAARPFARVERLFVAVEQALSRFDAQSELSRLNARPGEWVRVSPLLWEVLESALAMAQETGGRFDPTLLGALEAAGYGRTFGEIAAAGAVGPSSDSHRGRFREIGRRAAPREVFLPRGVRLDLGGIAKGWTAQRAVQRLRPWGPILVDAGGDLVAGDAPPGWPGWPVAIAAPSDGARPNAPDLAQLWLRNAALATSGVDFRRWQVNGATRHHIIDPRTGRPAATDLLAVTVLDQSAVRAEAWATATIVAGRERGAAALSRGQMAALFVHHDGRALMTRAMQSHMVAG